MKHLVALLFALCGAPHAAAADALREFHAVYEFERGRMTIGETVIRLERSQDDIYTYSSEARATGFVAIFVDDVIREESIFRFDKGEFWPVSYEYRQLNSDKNRSEDIAYDWRERHAQVNYRGHESQHALEAGMLDRFLLQLALTVHSQDGAVDHRYRVLDNGRVKEFTLRGSEMETVKTAQGSFDALRVERVDRNPDKTLTMWLAPSLGWLPVRIEQEKRNEEPLRLVLKKMDIAAASDETDN